MFAEDNGVFSGSLPGIVVRQYPDKLGNTCSYSKPLSMIPNCDGKHFTSKMKIIELPVLPIEAQVIQLSSHWWRPTVDHKTFFSV